MESIPVVSSADDIGSAIGYASRYPHARWYVARMAKVYGEEEQIPSEWGGMVAAFGGNYDQNARDTAASKGEALPDGSYPIHDKGDLRRAIQAFGRAKNKARAKRHIIKRARALQATAMLPDAWSGSVTASADMTAEDEAEYQKLSKMKSLTQSQKKRLTYLKSCMQNSENHNVETGYTASGEEEFETAAEIVDETTEEIAEDTETVQASGGIIDEASLADAVEVVDKLEGKAQLRARTNVVESAGQLGLLSSLPSTWLPENFQKAVTAGVLEPVDAWETLTAAADVAEEAVVDEIDEDAAGEMEIPVDDLAMAAIDSLLAYVQSTSPEASKVPVEALRAAAFKYVQDALEFDEKHDAELEEEEQATGTE